MQGMLLAMKLTVSISFSRGGCVCTYTMAFGLYLHIKSNNLVIVFFFVKIRKNWIFFLTKSWMNPRYVSSFIQCF